MNSNSIVSDNLFLILLIFSGALVCVRAYELYLTPTPRKDAQWLVDEMHLRHLTGQRQLATGFMFYLMPILFVYLLLAISPEILNLFMGIAGTNHSVGALNLHGSQVQSLAPVMAATAVITLFSVNPFSVFEQYLRRIAHNIAGVPQHVLDIFRQIRPMDFRNTSGDSPLPILKNGDVEARPGLESDLAAIQKLDEWTFGRVGIQLWSDKANQATHLAQHRIIGEYDLLRRKLTQLEIAPPDSDGKKRKVSALDEQHVNALDDIIRHARELRIQFTRLLAVLIANHDELLPKRVLSPQLWQLISRAQQKRASNRHINILAYGTYTGMAVSVLLATIFNFSLIVINELSLERVLFDYADNALLVGDMSAAEFYWSSLGYAVQASWWDVLGISLIFFSGCATALIYRISRVNSAQWEIWHPRDCHPVFQYVGAALLACVSAGLFYTLFLLFKLVLWPSLQEPNSDHFNSMLQDFGSDYMTFGLFALIVAPSAIMVCRVSDYFDITDNDISLWRDPWVYKLATWVGLVSMGIYLFVRLWIGESREFTVVALSPVIPGLTLFVMCTAYWRIGDARPGTARAEFHKEQKQEPERRQKTKQEILRDKPGTTTTRSEDKVKTSVDEEQIADFLHD